MKIDRIRILAYGSYEQLMEKLIEAVASMQDEKLTVEIQYSSSDKGFSALVIGRKGKV